MSRTISQAVLPIQRAMATANPSAWWDGLVIGSSGAEVTVAHLDGSVSRLRVVGPAVELVAGEPVAYHPVAEILDTSRLATTARISA